MPLDNALLEYFLSRAKRGVDPTGINPTFGQRLLSAMQAAEGATGSQARITDMSRPATRQAQYYANYTQRPVTWQGQTYSPQEQGGLAAPPGRSRHQIGQAADIARGPVLDWLHAHAPDYGLEFLPGRAGRNDPVHIQLARGWKGDLPSAAPQMMAQAMPSQVNATPDTPPPPQVQDPLQVAQAAQTAQAQPTQQPTQPPVDPVRSLFERMFPPKPSSKSPGFLSQMAENAGAPKGSLGMLGKLLMLAGSAGGGSPPPLPDADTASNVPPEDTGAALQRGQMAQAMVQGTKAQPDPNTPPPDPQAMAQLNPQQLAELKRKQLGSLFGLA